MFFRSKFSKKAAKQHSANRLIQLACGKLDIVEYSSHLLLWPGLSWCHSQEKHLSRIFSHIDNLLLLGAVTSS